MNHNFELSAELIDQIIFGMENQDHLFLLDLEHLKIYTGEELEEESVANPGLDPESGDFAVIPEWRSVDGYNLMERFVADLKNPLVKLELHGILQSGRGVFRQFKNCLKEHREVEKLWFSYKDREMKQRVLDWFNGIRESRGLEALKGDIFEAEDLVLSDFIIRQVDDPDELERVGQWDRQVFAGMYSDSLEAGYWYSFRRDHLPGVADSDNGSLVLGVYLPDMELCGFLWALHDELGEGPLGDVRGDGSAQPSVGSAENSGPLRSVGHILQLFVEPAYRGLGIATTLLEHYLEIVSRENLEVVTIENWSGSSYISNMLERLGFGENLQQYALDRRKR